MCATELILLPLREIATNRNSVHGRSEVLMVRHEDYRHLEWDCADVDSAFFRNFGKILLDYTVSRPKRREIPNKNFVINEYWNMRDLKP